MTRETPPDAADQLPHLRVQGGRAPMAPNEAAKAALVAYLRLLAICIEEEAEMIESSPTRAADLLRRFRSEVLDMSLGDAPVETLLRRAEMREES